MALTLQFGSIHVPVFAVLLATVSAMPVRKAVEEYPKRFEDLFVLPECRLLQTMDVVGFTIFGSPVRGAVCAGTCPQITEESSHSECPFGCAPADYNACSSSCFDGGSSECEAQGDETGDKVCYWDEDAGASGECRGCNVITESEKCDSQPNCEWQSSDAQCHVKGETTSPMCSHNGPCPGYTEEDCNTSTVSTSDQTCSATDFTYAYRFGARPKEHRTTSGPALTLVTKATDIEIIADWEEELPGFRRDRKALHEQGKYITGMTCNGPECMPTFSDTLSDNAVATQDCMNLATHVQTSAMCGLQGEQCDFKRFGIDATKCIPFWMLHRVINRVKIPSKCECI